MIPAGARSTASMTNAILARSARSLCYWSAIVENFVILMIYEQGGCSCDVKLRIFLTFACSSFITRILCSKEVGAFVIFYGGLEGS